MAERKQFLGNFSVDTELLALMEKSRAIPVSEEELREQRISFAYGNAMGREDITKESVRETSMHIRLQA